MDWRREDSGYAAATVCAVAFVAYLLAANFGLVPSPLAGLLDGSPPAAIAVAVAPDVGVTTDLPPPPAPAVRRPSAPLPPASAGATDTAAPAVSVSTPDGTTFGVVEPAIVEGTAADAGSGIEDVTAVFTTSSGRRVVTADVTCAGGGRTRCTWRAEVPAVLADYSVTATALDGAGNTAKTEPIDITVVNTGGTVEEVGDTVGRAPGAVDGAVDGLLKGLGGTPGG